MNIVHFSAGRINPSGAKVGLVNVIYWLAREQVRQGHKVTVIVIPEKIDYENVSEDAFRIVEYARSTRGGFVLDSKLLKDINNGHLKIDIAHLHSIWSLTMAAVGRALRKRGIPYVLSSHGSFSPMLLKRQPLQKHVFRRIFGLPLANHARFVHLHSTGEIKDAQSSGVRPKLVVAEQGMDLSTVPQDSVRDWFHHHHQRHDGTFKVVFLGRLDPWGKGLDLLLEGFALALREEPQMSLFLIGPEKKRYRTQLPALVAKLGLSGHVVFTGPLYDPANKYAALASADVFALPSRFEGFPLTVFEAMACGVPVIVTPGTNAADIVHSHAAGIVVAPKAEAIADAILTMKRDPAQRKAMGKRGEIAVSKFTWARTASLLDQAYKETLEA